jgi:hypothetical protein
MTTTTTTVRDARDSIEVSAAVILGRAERLARAAMADGASEVHSYIADECPSCVGGCHAAAKALGALVAAHTMDGEWHITGRQTHVWGDMMPAADAAAWTRLRRIMDEAQARATDRQSAAARAAEIIRAVAESYICGAAARVEVDGCTVDVEARSATTRVEVEAACWADELTALAVALACMAWADDMEVCDDDDAIIIEIGPHWYFESRATAPTETFMVMGTE